MRSLISWYLTNIYYQHSNDKDAAWFQSSYTEEEKQSMLHLLLNISGKNATVCQTNILASIAEQIFATSLPEENNNTQNNILAKLNQHQQQDFIALGVIISLSGSDNLSEHINIFIDYLRQINKQEKLIKLILAIRDKKKDYISRANIIGEGYQNQKARVNGIRQFGYNEYKKQMLSMKGENIHSGNLKKYAPLKDLPENTLGNKFYKMMRNSKLAIPGEKGGFSSFFLWHEISHILSHNNTNFSGEIATNAFTAGYVSSNKLRVLIWGLLQWSIGYSMAVVATSKKNIFDSKKTTDQYIGSLLCGLNCKIDLLDADIDQLLYLPVAEIKARYNIRPVEYIKFNIISSTK